MNISDLIIKTYGSFHNYGSLPFWFFTPLRKLFRGIANFLLPLYLSNKRSTNNYKFVEEKVVVSFTSFPARIENVWQVVECMLRQTVKPYKIILWLSRDQFPSKSDLPDSLLNRENDIFNIRFVDRDLKSHKKYYYSSIEYHNNLLFLIDDDIYYPSDIIEKSLRKYRDNPHCIVCNYGLQIVYDNNGNHLNYSQWREIENDNNIFLGSGGGTLFCPNDMYDDLVNIKLAMKLTPNADDIWLNTMARLNNLNIIHASKRILLPINIRNNKELSSINNGESQNDVQISNIENYYGLVFQNKNKI